MTERDQRIAENLGLVHACCRRFQGRGIEYEDLFQAGCVGLVKAIDRYRPELGWALSTYAVPVILGEIRCLFREGGSVKVSRALRELGLRALRLQEELSKAWGRSPTVGELAQRLDVPQEDVAQALDAARPALSLTRAGEDEETDCWDIPTDGEEESICETLTLRQAVEKLPRQDRRLLCLRYREEKTQSQTAAVLGMTQVQVSRREKAILQKIRAWMSAG